MSILWKLLLGVGIALPISAYVLGSLVASADEPAPRSPIVIEDASTSLPSGSPTNRGGDDRRGDDRDDRDDVDVVTPSPDDVDDHGDDAGRDDDDSGHGGGDDDSGHGSGDDDSSGHGSGGDDD